MTKIAITLALLAACTTSDTKPGDSDCCGALATGEELPSKCLPKTDTCVELVCVGEGSGSSALLCVDDADEVTVIPTREQ